MAWADLGSDSNWGGARGPTHAVITRESAVGWAKTLCAVPTV
jgi:hypothetical protein